MEKIESVSLDEYQEMLKTHDWYYKFSDDPGAYRAGVKREAYLIEIAVRNGFIKEFEAARPKENDGVE